MTARMPSSEGVRAQVLAVVTDGVARVTSTASVPSRLVILCSAILASMILGACLKIHFKPSAGTGDTPPPRLVCEAVHLNRPELINAVPSVDIGTMRVAGGLGDNADNLYARVAADAAEKGATHFYSTDLTTGKSGRGEAHLTLLRVEAPDWDIMTANLRPTAGCQH